MFIKTYSDFSLSTVGVRSDFVGPRMGTHFKLDNDRTQVSVWATRRKIVEKPFQTFPEKTKKIMISSKWAMFFIPYCAENKFYAEPRHGL
jgi:hypothetical protein